MAIDRREREARMLDLLAKDGSLTVAALSQEFDVSEVTIRTQLRALEERGVLKRTRGGAQATAVRHVLEREREHEAEKERIAAAAAALVRDGDRIMIEAGTTAARIVRHLANRHGVQIVTNSTLVFGFSRHNANLTVILTGGTFHRESESLIGPVALRAVRDFNVRLAFIGTDGFTPNRGLTTQFSEGAEVITAMHAQAEQTWLVADSSKYGQAGFVSVLPLRELSGVITDTRLDQPSVAALRETGPIVTLV